MSNETLEKLYLVKALDLISNTTILGVFYGIAFSLYCLCAQSLYIQLRDPDKRKQSRFTLGYISLLLFCTTGYLVACVRLRQVAYVNHASLPWGPLVYEASSKSYMEATVIFDCALEVLTLGIQVGCEVI